MVLVQAGDELGEVVELRVGEEADKVRAVARADVVALQVQGDVAECDGVAVDAECAQGGGGGVLAGLLGG